MTRALVLTALLVLAGARGASAASPIAVSDAWSRPATGMGVVYATITNSGDTPDRLIGAMTPAASSVEMHETTHGTGAQAAVESMHAVDAIVIPAHGTVTLAPGGYHLMLVGLKSDLHGDDAFLTRLHFERAGWIVTIVKIRPI